MIYIKRPSHLNKRHRPSRTILLYGRSLRVLTYLLHILLGITYYNENEIKLFYMYSSK